MVLVVEDDAASAEVLCEMLEMAGYRATSVGTLEAAVRGASSPDYSAVLLDLTLVGYTTVELISGIAQVPDRPPVVIYSALLTEEVDAAAGKLHAVAALQKPARMEVILEAVARAVGMIVTAKA